MSELVLLHHNEPMTTSLAIAEGVEMEHSTVIKLVRKYVEDLQKFGTFGFEIQKSGGRPTEVAFLNEGQSIFLLTLMRNSEIVVRFKLALVQAFLALRDNLQKIQSNATSAQFLTGNPTHGADLAVAADRTFRSYLRAARSAGMALPAALKIANVKTVERTGIDMLAELDVNPDAPPNYGPVKADERPDPLAEALARWAAAVPAGAFYAMTTILQEACGIAPGSKAFERQSPAAGRALRRLGFEHRKIKHEGRQRHLWSKNDQEER